MKNQKLINGDVFIIPNPSYIHNESKGFKLPSFIIDLEKVYWGNKNLNKGNNTFDETRFVECWFCNKDHDNWRDHGVGSLEEGNELSSKEERLEPWRLSTSWVPSWIFDGHKEGDVVTFCMPVNRRDYSRGVTELSTIKVSMRLNQSNYRYKRFGKFEEVLARV